MMMLYSSCLWVLHVIHYLYYDAAGGLNIKILVQLLARLQFK